MSRTSMLRVLRDAVRVAGKERQSPLSPQLMNRRHMLGLAAGSLAWYGCVSRVRMNGASFSAVASKENPIIILGGGISGLTAAYYLQKHGVPFQIYEGSRRLGGRIYTKEEFNDAGMFCELGAEFIDNQHEDILGLARELGLTVENLDVSQPEVLEPIFFMKGSRYRFKDLVFGIKDFLNELKEDQKLIFGDNAISVPTYQHAFNSKFYDQKDLASYLDQKKSLPAWIKSYIRIAYEGEYGLEAYQQSALNLIMNMGSDIQDGAFEVYRANNHSKRIRGGNSELVRVLQEKLVLDERAGVNFFPEHELVALKDNGMQTTLTFKTLSQTKDVVASRVICTLPFGCLRRVDGIATLDFSPQKKLALQNLNYGTHSKFMFGFKERFWTKSIGPKERGSDGRMTFDTGVQEFWDTSHAQKGEGGILTNLASGARGQSLNLSDGDAILKELRILFPQALTSHDHHRAMMNWARHPYALGSRSCFRPGDYGQFVGAIGQPELKGRFLFAGEHCSLTHPGFMNGAVETGKSAALALVVERTRRA